MKPYAYITTYCNKPHRMSDGKPMTHECRIIPPKALEAELLGDFEEAVTILQASKPRYMARGAKWPARSHFDVASGSKPKA